MIPPQLSPPSQQALREQLERLVVNDLLGPAGGPHEEISERYVKDRYLVGLLAPRRIRIVPAEHEPVSVEDNFGHEDGSEDIEVPQSESLHPSSVGLSFCVAGECQSFQVTARWGHYLRKHSTLTFDKEGSPVTVWKRHPREGASPPIPLREGEIPRFSVHPDQPDVYVKGLIRRNSGDFVVSLFLVNGQDEPKRRRDEGWLFQPELSVQAPDGSPLFRRRLHRRDPRKLDASILSEELALQMLYRRQVEFAVGHGVAVRAYPLADDPNRATRVEISVLPAYEVAAQEPPTAQDRPELEQLCLDMKTLSELSGDKLQQALAPLPTAYHAWITAESQKLTNPEEGLESFQDPAREALERCRENLRRIEAGIQLLAENPQAEEAFRFANRTMWRQRIHSLHVEAVRRDQADPMDDPNRLDEARHRTWRTFQLAFVLINLPSLTDLTHPHRTGGDQALADLLWFPTGGGKTEAYLGLTAYTLAIRRLQGTVANHSGEFGVGVLMRYTLRVLTLQQFQRATTLIAACEVQRLNLVEEGDTRWGAEPFRIGLWVGMKTTPNRTSQSQEWQQANRDQPGKGSLLAGVGTPAQLTNCPWCGSKILPGRDIKVDPFERGTGRTHIYCPSGACLFSARGSQGEGIPVLVVDEEIYRRPPALLIATVDKFAQMPWQGPIQTLFGQISGICTRHGFRSPDLEDASSHPARPPLPAAKTLEHLPLRPPDLIIQDELHLISGPLGSLVGLYETAVDALCQWEVEGKLVRPKIIASTATVRNAKDQVYSLFQRQLNVFPPHGTDIRDNFFSIQRAPSTLPGRRYLGICAPGRRMKSALIRVYVALLGAAQTVYEQQGKRADPWMTLVGYFNAMRELAGMRRLVDDEVRSRLRDAPLRGLGRRGTLLVEELTSRKSSTDIPRLLDLLELPFDPADLEARKAAPEGGTKKPRPLDVLLATNMISVGVDVKRFGLMVVAGQPKTTAEYIQATSRVGRSFPGLVVTVYNWARPRDLSHYEQFEQYHATFYQHVEALSVTPFASRAVDRGLAAVLVSLIRLGDLSSNPNLGAEQVKLAHPRVAWALKEIARRAGRVLQDKASGAAVLEQSKKLLDNWLHEAGAQKGSRLGYKQGNDGKTRALLKPAGAGTPEPFTCLNSLRDVEPTVALILEDFGMDDDAQNGPPVKLDGATLTALTEENLVGRTSRAPSEGKAHGTYALPITRQVNSETNPDEEALS